MYRMARAKHHTKHRRCKEDTVSCKIPPCCVQRTFRGGPIAQMICDFSPQGLRSLRGLPLEIGNEQKAVPRLDRGLWSAKGAEALTVIRNRAGGWRYDESWHARFIQRVSSAFHHVFGQSCLGSSPTRNWKHKVDEKQASGVGDRCLRAIRADSASCKVRPSYSGGRGLLPGAEGRG
jgi:hypothetical protein